MTSDVNNKLDTFEHKSAEIINAIIDNRFPESRDKEG